LLGALHDHITVSPNGVMFVKPSVRRSLLAKMLTEILDTRVMVKRSMKENKNDKALLTLLESRQLGLKLLANVTYGYTGASYSGRMPCVEVADSIVQTGRETLEKVSVSFFLYHLDTWYFTYK
jgi:DNA polymerase zeta